MSTVEKILAIAAIENGTVIDHVPAGCALKILQALGLIKENKQITLASNLHSGSMDRKDLIKIEEGCLEKEQLDVVAVFAPNATINVINNYTVAGKYQVEIPEHIKGKFACPNARCITNHEPMPTHFEVSMRRQEVILRCRYCCKTSSHEDLA
jgi:aspartate carbamoyltransferase regulatory subunit